ncbi:MAG: preprotein translocase subunit SecG [Gammaproteobacteria bacterium]
MLFSILIALMVLLGIILIVLILLHQGKGADAGAQFGSGASGTVFGSRGSSSFMTRTIGVLMTLFVVLALVMVWLARHGAVHSNSVMAAAGAPTTTSAPMASTATPAAVTHIQSQPAASTRPPAAATK